MPENTETPKMCPLLWLGRAASKTLSHFSDVTCLRERCEMWRVQVRYQHDSDGANERKVETGYCGLAPLEG